MQPDQTPFSDSHYRKDLPLDFDGTYSWLDDAPVHQQWAIGERSEDLLAEQLESAISSASEHGVKLPREFTSFIGNSELHKRIRSSSACYLDVAYTIIPLNEGFLLRFLNDQQHAAFWYLYVDSAATDNCVVCSYEYHDLDDGDYELDEIETKDFHIRDTDFEQFVFRMWIENELNFAQDDKSILGNIPKKYLELYA